MLSPLFRRNPVEKPYQPKQYEDQDDESFEEDPSPSLGSSGSSKSISFTGRNPGEIPYHNILSDISQDKEAEDEGELDSFKVALPEHRRQRDSKYLLDDSAHSSSESEDQVQEQCATISLARRSPIKKLYQPKEISDKENIQLEEENPVGRSYHLKEEVGIAADGSKTSALPDFGQDATDSLALCTR